MYQTSETYKNKIYEPSTRHLLKVYINNEEVEGKYILECKISQTLFNNGQFRLGSVTSKTVELKLHKLAIKGEINNVYIESGIENEIVPIGYFNVEEIKSENDYTVSLKLLDNMIKFEKNYNGEALIKRNGYAKLKEILQDICTKTGVELRFYFFFEYE